MIVSIDNLSKSSSIRIATWQDLPAIVNVYNQAIAERNATADLEPKRVEEQRQWFEAHPPASFPIYVYEHQGEVVGWCSISAYRPGRKALQEVGEISCYVGVSYRGKGVGSCLVENALNDCPRIGKRILFAIVIEGNAGSLKLLNNHGFVQWGFLPDVINFDGELKGQLYMGKKVAQPSPDQEKLM